MIACYIKVMDQQIDIEEKDSTNSGVEDIQANFSANRQQTQFLKEILPPTDSLSLESIAAKYSKETFPAETFLTPKERQIVFHGTQASQVDKFQAGFFSKNDQYAVLTHDIGTAVSDKFSDGTVLVWDPPTDSLSPGDRVNMAITVPRNTPVEVSSIVRKSKSTTSKPETYLSPEHFAEVLSFTPEQMRYLKDFSLNLRYHPETLDVSSLSELMYKFSTNFPNQNKLHGKVMKESFGIPLDRLLKVMAIKTYESALKTATVTALNKFSGQLGERRDKLEAFPTFGVPAYEEYKRAKESLVV